MEVASQGGYMSNKNKNGNNNNKVEKHYYERKEETQNKNEYVYLINTSANVIRIFDFIKEIVFELIQ